MNKNIFVTLLLISLLFLSGCTGDACIDPDDFGFIKFNISSRYKEYELTSRQEGDQSAPWRDSAYRVNGYPLTVVVRPWYHEDGDKNKASELSAWCPWYGKIDNTETLSDFCLRLQKCRFIDDNMCPSPTPSDAPIINAPCLMKDGVGLYFLIADRNTNPNMSPDSQRNPRGISKHLGEPTNGHAFYSVNKRGEFIKSGGINYQYDGVTPSDYALSPLYFKILDKFYDDNAGQYRVVIKSGVMDTRPDPLEALTYLIKTELFGNETKHGIVRQVYQNIIDTPGYRISVSALLTLYIIFTVLSFLIGNINITQVELITRILKISIVSILLSSTASWQFFNDYLFVFFVDGLDFVLRIIKDVSTTGPGSSSLLGLLIAPQTLSKLFSLLFVDWLGFIYILLYLIALYFIFMLIFKATIIYLTALITIGLIITMAPIFICFMLFNITRSLFENWLRQLISYALQPIILFVGIAFISMLIRTEIYSTLGFAVCKHDFPNLGPLSIIFGGSIDDIDSSLNNSIFYWWFPVPMKGGINNFHKANILVPMDFKKDDGTHCTAYECVDERYIELPFLDLVKDAARISRFINGKFVQLDGLLLIFVSIYLLSKFNDTAVSTARFLSSTSGNLTSLQSVGNQAYAPIAERINKPFSYVGTKASSSLNTLTRLVSTPLAQKYEEFMTERVKKEAIDSKSSNRAVQNEVKRSYGIDHRNINNNAIKDYRDAIEKSFPELQNQAKLLSKTNYYELRNKLAETKFTAKDYDSLTPAQQSELDGLIKKQTINGKSLRELASDANYTKDYQDAYLNVHQHMSERGIGLFGKNIGVLRDWQEMQHRVKTKKELKKQKRYARGEKIFATYTGLKRDLLTTIAGGKIRDAYEGNITSAEWHDFNYNDPALRTYSESLKDQDRAKEYEELRLQIDKETLSTQEDVLSPEYLARLELQGRKDDIAYYQNLDNKKINYEVRQKLSEGEDPIIMGERFMKEKATDSQMHDMIDRAHAKHAELINNDWYSRRQEHYKIMREKAEDNITDRYKLLKDHYHRDITVEEIPELIAQYRQEEGDGYIASPTEIADEINSFKADIRNFKYSGEVLNKIEDRKEAITQEVNNHINEINKYRKAATMKEYIKPVVHKHEGRKLKTLEEHLNNR